MFQLKFKASKRTESLLKFSATAFLKAPATDYSGYFGFTIENNEFLWEKVDFEQENNNKVGLSLFLPTENALFIT